jgi:hypothetical protein
MVGARLRQTVAALAAAACCAGCSDAGSVPMRPSSLPVSPDAAADGSTLKVTAPELVSPTGGVLVADLDPDMVFGHAVAVYVSTTPPLQYEMQIFNEEGALDYHQVLNPSGGGTTSHEVQKDLRESEAHTWRVRARLGEYFGPWSDVGSFVTFAPPSVLPVGPYPTDGPGVAAYVANTWPEYLAPTATFEERRVNMHFLRDRMIEVGRCGGLDLALNTKANGIISDDAITWKFGPTDGDVEVVDIALDWDNNDNDLRLHWAITEGPAGYTPLPNPGRCRFN